MIIILEVTIKRPDLHSGWPIFIIGYELPVTKLATIKMADIVAFEEVLAINK